MRFARLSPPDQDRPAFFARLEGAAALVLDAPPWLGGKTTGEAVAWAEVDLACPVAPTKIVCVGRNYAAHAQELGNDVPVEPLLFLKPPSALIGPGQSIVLPPESQRVEHEAELGVIIGRRCKAVRPEEAADHVFGYTCLGDITARDLQRKDVQFTRGKGFDTFCPVGPWIETAVDPAALRVRAVVNGQVRQDGMTAQMLWGVPALVAYISRVMTLEPGDVIATGTPQGVGPLVSGDELVIDIAGATAGAPGIGPLRVSVAAPQNGAGAR
ncbi:fumarylacetoacetate hydrolase family protein [Sorangium cellulosum]|uniref:2-hydroxyhepta-2,4-diene-1,7-dioate isomerase n=2 Tax=Sorangium cellulosum TaxID=56 RepID=A0A150TKN6_SORCE|nr:fumarylacetoacetate hydrolase family protein [Sorangium cellulosum]AGP32351.1 2-hydroxyhepta-2,4-diene-1,7-dioate isomerase [Sorangium cellulosum So0157-2]KYG05269.1 2-hydroxyhepta-2,4-diene-1,7-dioate isomerase [Sorangium cellulosum]